MGRKMAKSYDSVLKGYLSWLPFHDDETVIDWNRHLYYSNRMNCNVLDLVIFSFGKTTVALDMTPLKVILMVNMVEMIGSPLFSCPTSNRHEFHEDSLLYTSNYIFMIYYKGFSSKL